MRCWFRAVNQAFHELNRDFFSNNDDKNQASHVAIVPSKERRDHVKRRNDVIGKQYKNYAIASSNQDNNNINAWNDFHDFFKCWLKAAEEGIHHMKTEFFSINYDRQPPAYAGFRVWSDVTKNDAGKSKKGDVHETTTRKKINDDVVGKKQNKNKILAIVPSKEDIKIISSNEHIKLFKACTGQTCQNINWVVDTRAEEHFTPHKECFTSYRSGDFGTARMENNTHAKVVGIGDVRIETNLGRKLILKDVRHIPDFHENVISIGRLDDEGYTSKFTKGQWKLTKGFILVANGEKGKKYSSLYTTPAIVHRCKSYMVEKASTGAESAAVEAWLEELSL